MLVPTPSMSRIPAQSLEGYKRKSRFIRSNFKKINSTLNELRKEITGDNHNQTISRYTNLGGELEQLFHHFDGISSSFFEKSIAIRTKNIDFFSKHDVMRDVIDELTDNRIGPAPSQQNEIDDINKEGKVRYKYKTGPGYEDVSDKKNDFYSFGEINYDAEFGRFICLEADIKLY
ncbi:PIN-like domain-containing protein [Pantoea sp. EABMAA-21]|uniref:PIN-like domain-containing protein n=1 Tax=Pantoea sp. EABMAA-21 TaxID=3043302 RepID=UPI0024B4EC31|nr:PIN-like domain-containing protein [Pantoea sp. EABMAA-21]MDI9279994.1 PIN-like domain-containing protein [Pantoea sp. EABMAA-21]